jgi:ribonuclease BN (tRNA processing enzyme)
VRLTIIGSAGTFPGPMSACSSYLVEQEGFRLLLDVGNGSLGALQSACGLLGPDAVIVSHLHGDHYLDLVTWTYARRYHPDGAPPILPVYGPRNIKAAIAGAFGRDVTELLDEVYDFRGLDRDQQIEVGPFTVDLAHVNHPVETYGMRVSAAGRSLAYSADSGISDALVGLAGEADLFLCEASFLEGEDNPPDIHLTGREAAEYATRAGADQLLLTHLVPWGDEDRTLSEAHSGFDSDIGVARPLAVHDV